MKITAAEKNAGERSVFTYAKDPGKWDRNKTEAGSANVRQNPRRSMSRQARETGWLYVMKLLTDCSRRYPPT